MQQPRAHALIAPFRQGIHVGQVGNGLRVPAGLWHLWNHIHKHSRSQRIPLRGDVDAVFRMRAQKRRKLRRKGRVIRAVQVVLAIVAVILLAVQPLHARQLHLLAGLKHPNLHGFALRFCVFLLSLYRHSRQKSKLPLPKPDFCKKNAKKRKIPIAIWKQFVYN